MSISKTWNMKNVGIWPGVYDRYDMHGPKYRRGYFEHDLKCNIGNVMEKVTNDSFNIL